MNQKLKLLMDTKTTHVICYSDLEKFIQDVFGFTTGWEILESANDTTHVFDVYDGGDYEELLEGAEIILAGHGEYYNIGLVLNYLCHKQLIPSGNYSMHVSW
jgi:hypothetical protein